MREAGGREGGRNQLISVEKQKGGDLDIPPHPLKVSPNPESSWSVYQVPVLLAPLPVPWRGGFGSARTGGSSKPEATGGARPQPWTGTRPLSGEPPPIPSGAPSRGSRRNPRAGRERRRRHHEAAVRRAAAWRPALRTR